MMGKKRREEREPEGVRGLSDQVLHRQKRYRPNVASSDGSRSLTAIRADIKNLGWQLEKIESLPADAREEKERELAKCRVELEDGLAKQQRKRMISRYHMVRFFERQKSTRALKRHQKALETVEPSATDYEGLKAAVYEAEVDLNYTMFYPLAEKYVSLYPRSPDQDAENIGGNRERKVGGERPVLWFLVERAMKEGTLQELRDGKGKQLALGRSKGSVDDGLKADGDDEVEANEDDLMANDTVMTEGSNKLAPAIGRLERETSHHHDDSQSDGGFFEE